MAATATKPIPNVPLPQVTIGSLATRLAQPPHPQSDPLPTPPRPCLPLPRKGKIDSAVMASTSCILRPTTTAQRIRHA